jgi:hypothetical protein
MDEWRTSAVHQRPYNGALPRLSRKNNLSNEMNDLIMAEQVVLDTTIWVSNIHSGSRAKLPFFGRERYARDAAV